MHAWRGRAGSFTPDDRQAVVTRSSPRSAEELARLVASTCAVTRGGIDATPEDVATAQGAGDELEHVQAAAGSGAGASNKRTAAWKALEGTTWRLVGCVQRTLPAPGSWLASPFFWVAKEAQHESYRLSQLEGLFPPFKLAAQISAGKPPKTGEEWIAAFGRREVAAAFPFSIIESLLNGLQVPFQSGDAVLEFHELASGDDGSEALRMVSRVHVDFANGRVAGDLVTECELVDGVAGGSGRGEVGDDEEIRAGTATACLVSTRFEGTGTWLDGVVVPSGRIMAALMSPSPRLRRQRGPNGLPGVPYHRLHLGGGVLVARSGSCEGTSTLLAYERTEVLL